MVERTEIPIDIFTSLTLQASLLVKMFEVVDFSHLIKIKLTDMLKAPDIKVY